MDEIEALKRALNRERLARKSAEKLLEDKSRDLFDKNEELKLANLRLAESLDKKEIEKNIIASFPIQNPNPVLRLNEEDLSVAYINSAGERLIEENKNHQKELMHKIRALTREALSKESVTNATLDFNNQSYALTIKPIKNQKLINLYFKDQTKLKEAINLLAKNEEKYRTIVEIAEDIIIKTDDECKIIYLNPAAEKKLLLTKTESIGMDFLSFVSEEYREGYRDYYFDETIDKKYLEFPITLKNGSEIWLGQNIIRTDSQIKGRGNKLSISRDITESFIYRDKLRRSEDRYKKAIGNMRLGLLEVDVDGIVNYVHNGFTLLTGFTSKDLLGKNANTFFELGGESVERRNKHNKSRAQGRESIYEIKMKNKEGDWMNILISGAPLYNDENEIIGSMGIHMDITEQKENEQKLLEQTLKAEESARAKELFLANMSHEIRTPLNAIIGVSNLMNNTDLDLKQLEYNSIVETAAINLKSIINGILDLSKITSGKMSLERSPINIEDVVQFCKKTNILKAEENGNEIHIEFDQRISSSVLGDYTRLCQILNNLLSNAVKFTQFGQIRVNAELIYEKDSKQKVKFSVRDNGIGIESNKIKHILESFTQEDESTTRKFGGTGLGLSITRDLIGLYGSTLEIKSKKGIGSAFSFIIEFEKTDEVPLKEINSDEQPDLKGVKILLAEDNKFNQTVVRGVLEPYNVLLSVVENGQEVLDFLEKDAVDLILMDIQMPVLNGVDCSKIIRKEISKDLPILAVSANAFKEDIEKYLEAGMNDYISKPFEPHALIQKIALAVSKTLTIKEIIDKIDSIEEENQWEVSNLYSLHKLEKMLSGNQKFIQDSIQSFIKHTPLVLEEMKQALVSKDYIGLSKYAHRLKASCDVLSIESVKIILHQLEKELDQLPETEIEDKVNELIRVLLLVIDDVHKTE